MSFFVMSQAQIRNLQSLEKELSNTSQETKRLDVVKIFLRETEALSITDRLGVLEDLFALPIVQNQAALQLEIGCEIAIIHSKLGQSDACLDMYFALLNNLDKARFPIYFSKVKTGIGYEYFYLQEFDKATTYFKTALENNRIHRDSSTVAASLINLATAYSRTIAADSAKQYFELGLNYYQNLKDSAKIGLTLNNLGSFYHRVMGETAEAINYFEKALHIHQKIQNHYDEGVTLLNLGTLYYEQGEVNKGIQLLRLALTRGQQLQNIPLHKLALQNLLMIYESEQYYDSAFYYQKQYQNLLDSLQLSEQKSIISKLEEAYFKAENQKEKEIAALKISRLYQGIAIAALIIILLSSLAIYYRRTKKLKEDLEKKKSMFYANLAHEFRTPISLIQSPARQIKQHSNDQKINQNAELILTQSEHLLGLFNELIAVSKLEEGVLQPNFTETDLVQFCEEMISEFEVMSEKKQVGLILKSDTSSLRYSFDFNFLKKALNNLISNAVQFSPIEKKIIIELSINHSSQIIIAVKDEGPGIAEDFVPKLFQRYQTNKKQHGVGLGLSLSKSLLNSCGGDLFLAKNSSSGATFNIVLPITSEKSIVSPQINLEEKPVVLIVEDHQDLREHLATELSESFQCYTAENGKSGYQLALKLIPDVILSDVVMPEMDGVEMASLINQYELTEHIPIVLLSAKKDTKSIQTGLKAGAISYLGKPFVIAEIKQLILGFWNWQKKLEQRFSTKANESTDEEKNNGLLHHPNSFIQKIKSIVEQHLSNNEFGVNELSEELGLSRTQVHRKLKAICGLSTTAVIKHIRLEHAALIFSTEKELNVSEIAFKTGFSSVAYFSKSFSEYFQIPPSEFKAKF